ALSNQGPGRPMEGAGRAFMETAFGRDLGNVRIHTDTAAANAATMLNANAFTVGSDIYFAAGRYGPETLAGRTLLAHEITHTIQRESGTGSAARSSRPVSDPNDASEREAESIARRVAAGSPVTAEPTAGGAMIQRQEGGGSGILSGLSSGIGAA